MNAIEMINEWKGMEPEQQLNFCNACVCKAIKQGRMLKPGYDMGDATQETYCKVLKRLADVDKLEADCKRRESQGKAGNTLAAVVCRAANSTMECVAYHSGKDSKATSRTITSEDGDETNQQILAGRIDGLTEREISQIVCISNVAVHNRLAKMQKALAAMLN